MMGRPCSMKSSRAGATGALITLLLLVPGAARAQDGAWSSNEVLAAKEWVAPPGDIADAVLAQGLPDGADREIQARVTRPATARAG